MKQVLFLNGWSDDNKGDAAIVHGLIHLLRKKHPDIQVSLVSSFPRTDPAFERHHRFTSAQPHNVAAHAAILPLFSAEVPRGRRRILTVLALAKSVLLLIVAPFLRNPITLRWLGRALGGQEVVGALTAYRNSDLLIAKGGHIYFASHSLPTFVGLYINLFPVLLGLRFGKPVVIYGQSIGPVLGRAHRAMLRWALRRCVAVVARERQTQELVTDILGPSNSHHVMLAWDTAFAVKPEPLPEELHRALPRDFAVVTLRQWHFPYAKNAKEGEDAYAKYLDSVAAMIEYCQTELNLPIVFAPQVTGPTPAENDFVAWDAVLQRCRRGYEVIQVRDDLTPGQLAALYGRAAFVVGTRFHSVILSLAAGTPALAIAYHGYKAQGIMEMIGMSDMVTDIGKADAADLSRRIATLHRDARDLRMAVLAQKSRIDVESEMSLEQVLALVDGGRRA